MQVEVLRVFVDERGDYGNPLGVVLDGASVPEPAQRQQLAATLGFSETIFIDDAESGRLRIFTPATELPFAGHPTVGAAWVLSRELGHPPAALETPGGVVPTWIDGDQVWVRGLLAATPPWWHERLADGAAVDALDGPLGPEQDATQLWAWRDEAAGVIRARVFAARYGVAEDEACGSASMRLAAVLGRDITVHHGRGSIVYARPGPPGTAEIGGRVVSDGVMSGLRG
ncbi:PhzF family phenazine biosynthesis protein [Mycolicibacter icosiumassiliensis]|uniref:PhzF family phenazine biosynthesis protein n=1 Tax=Mycolicibacter icosiumassiliensis TaxID=1792835 RepID=UPI00082D1BD0|nr:PhzF family phenazine biosynthesis protein [Mycolicibacter icosiumassiliensis]